MHIVRLVLISGIVLFLIITGMSLFIPSHVKISRAVNIKASKDTVMAQISDPGKWRNWYPGMDTAVLVYEQGMVKGVAVRSSMIIVKTVEPNKVTAEYSGKKLKPVVVSWQTLPAPGSDSLALQWYMDFHLRWYPWEKFASLLLEKSYGPMMENGLGKLKKLVEN